MSRTKYKFRNSIIIHTVERVMRRVGKVLEELLVDRQEKYIVLRIEQLKEDMSKAHDEMDKAWYNRLIQELNWVLQMKGKPSHNCYMEQESKEIWT